MIDNLALYIILAIVVAFLLLRFFLFVHLYTRCSSLPQYLRSSHDKSGRAWAMVTGASDGLGLAFSHELARRGFNIVLHGRNAQKLKAAEISLKRESPNVDIRIVIVDALQSKDDIKAQLAALVATLDDIHLRVLVNNIGGHPGQPPFRRFEEGSLEHFEDEIQLNVHFPLRLSAAILPLLLVHKTPSLIINIGSLLQSGTPWMSAYSGSKAFMTSWSRSLQMEMQGEGHQVEVLGMIIGGITGVSYRKRPPSLIMPAARTAARAALDKVGCGKMVVVGYYGHAILQTLMGFMDMLPESVLKKAMISGIMAERKALESEMEARYTV